MTGGRRFELKRQLGEGSFGTVYLAEMVSNGGFRTTVALKMLGSQWAADSDAGRRLRDEARLLGRLEHPDIVRVYDLVRVEGSWAVVMEAVRGADLEGVIAIANRDRDPAPVRAAFQLIGRVADALNAALTGCHDRDTPLCVVHRDIKPSNLILTARGDVKVLDFGIAGADLSGREADTSNIGFGSVPYMSPERLRGEEAQAPGDVYSLGAVLFELLVGNGYGRAMVVQDKAAEMQAGRVEELRLSLGESPASDACVSLIEEMLAFDPVDRPNVGDVAQRLFALVDVVDDGELARWASRVVPTAAEVDARAFTSASGVLSEDSSGSEVLMSAIPQSTGGISHSPTLVASDMPVADLPPPQTPTTMPTPPARRSRWPVVAVVALLLTGGISWPLLRTPATPPLEAEPAPELQLVAIDSNPAPTAPEPSAVQVATAQVATAQVTQAQVTQAQVPQAQVSLAVARPRTDSAPQRIEEASPGQDQEPTALVTTKAVERAPSSMARRGSDAEPSGTDASAATALTDPEQTPVATVRMVKVVVPDASSVQASCGSRGGSGTTSLLVREAPVGDCIVLADIGGKRLEGRVAVTEPAAFTCLPGAGGLSCN